MHLKAYPKTHLKICNKILLCYYCQDFQFQSFPTTIPEETPVIKKAAVSAGMPYSDGRAASTHCDCAGIDTQSKDYCAR